MLIDQLETLEKVIFVQVALVQHGVQERWLTPLK